MTGAERARIAALARAWIGTPYRRGAAVRGAGSDCLGLVRGLWAEARGAALPPVPAHGPDWSIHDPGLLERELARHLRRADPAAGPMAGQVLLFRLRALGPGGHLGVLTDVPGGGRAGRFVHAYGGHGVVESPLSEPWARRIAARFELV